MAGFEEHEVDVNILAGAGLLAGTPFVLWPVSDRATSL